MNVDELLADPCAAVGLPADGIPVHAIVILEYEDAGTGSRYLCANSDDALPSWSLRGMLIESYDVVHANQPTYMSGGVDDSEEDD